MTPNPFVCREQNNLSKFQPPPSCYPLHATTREKSLVYRHPRVSEDLKLKGLFLLLGPRQYVRGLLIDDTTTTWNFSKHSMELLGVDLTHALLGSLGNIHSEGLIRAPEKRGQETPFPAFPPLSQPVARS